jgi:hypothetical protein
MNQESRIDSEWVALNAFRELLKLSTKGDLSKSTYGDALAFGGQLYPALLGRETSVLRSVRESDTTKEYRQRARLQTQKTGKNVAALELLLQAIEELEDLLKVASQKQDRGRVDQLKNRLKILKASKDELAPPPHSENQLIFRDASAVTGGLPALDTGKAYRDFQLPDENVLRVRVLHPDVPEHVSGADIIYERHAPYEEKANLVVVQYKIWEGKVLHLSDTRMQAQLKKLQTFACNGGLCKDISGATSFRFPFCSAFLRPTDKLQHPDQKFISSGEHLPICRIDACSTQSSRGGSLLEYEHIRETSLSGEAFVYLFTSGKVGSRSLTYAELAGLYSRFRIASESDHLVIYAQEFSDN